MNKKYFKFLQKQQIPRGYERHIQGLTDGAVFSVVASASAVTLVAVLAISHTHTPVLARQVAAGVHCQKEEKDIGGKCRSAQKTIGKKSDICGCNYQRTLPVLACCTTFPLADTTAASPHLCSALSAVE